MKCENCGKEYDKYNSLSFGEGGIIKEQPCPNCGKIKVYTQKEMNKPIRSLIQKVEKGEE